MKKTLIFIMLIWSTLFAQHLAAQSSDNSCSNIDLKGQWRIAIDSTSVGESQHWETKALAGSIDLPGCTDEIGIGNTFPLFRSALGNRPPADYPKDADYGMLTRKHKYLGVAWYQKEIMVPTSSDKNYFYLQLERVMWRSKVWVDGELKGEPIDFLSSPHLHALGNLNKGKHTITIMIDNRQVYPVGVLAHSYCPHMQTQWNGAVGKIELIAKPMIMMDQLQVFPSFQNKTLTIKVQLNNQGSISESVSMNFAIKEKKTGKQIYAERLKIEVQKGVSVYEKNIQLKESPLGWDEFNPNLYELTSTLVYKKQKELNTTSFGFRDLTVVDKHFAINGRKLMYRNNHEGLFFAQTGYPAMDKAYWINVFNIYKAHGFNACRFHSSCPPEAAFDAADELGIYLQVEFFWMDGWMGLKDLIGEKNASLNRFAKDELHQALLAYGNHPSMMLVAYGNEMGGNFDRMGEWLAEEKKQDPRHLYAAGIAHNITTADDYVEYGGKNKVKDSDGTDWDYSDNYNLAEKHNYDQAFRRRNLAEFTHELGQYVVHPLWSEIDGYKGALKPSNLEYCKKKAVEIGIDKLDSAFQRASGNLNRIFYKGDIEATLRTKESAGYALLSMVDYPGQGEALIGWVNPRYEQKLFLTPQQFKQYGNHTVPLLRFPKFVWQNEEEFTGEVSVSNFGQSIIDKAQLHYTFKDGTQVISEGILPAVDLPQGELTNVGTITQKLITGAKGKKITITLSIPTTEYTNSWDIWVFPKPTITKVDTDIFTTTSIDTALIALKQGKKVLFFANKSGSSINNSYACFAPVFWSGTWFAGQESEILGTLIRNQHPALKDFPTDIATDWQWKEICDGARGFDLYGLPKDYQPIIQPVNDYHFGKKLGSLFELTTNKGGRLMVCGYDLATNLNKRIAAAALRKNIINYMHSDDFHPQTTVQEDWLANTFYTKPKMLTKPKGFENALVYVKAGENQEKPGNADWDKSIDQSFMNTTFDYSIEGAGIWKDGDNTAWYGNQIHIEIRVDVPALMTLKIRFHDWNKAGRTGEISCDDVPIRKLGAHINGEWISIPISRENCLDKKLDITIKKLTGPNLMITDLVLEPLK